jgi:hypothetical protein
MRTSLLRDAEGVGEFRPVVLQHLEGAVEREASPVHSATDACNSIAAEWCGGVV